MIRMLVIEDDQEINHLLCKMARQNGIETNSAYNGIDGIQKALSGQANIIIMDLMLPMKTGEEILKALRASGSKVPVIVISAKGEVYNRIELFKLGADDYITKPFDIDEVMLRVMAVLRRTGFISEENILRVRNLCIDVHAKRVFVHDDSGKTDTEIVLTRAEYMILEHMMRDPAVIYSKRKLYEILNGDYYQSDDNTMNVHISNLRKKIKKAANDDYIETIYGMGYRLI